MDPKPKKPAKPSEPIGKWTAEHENILVEWADKAACYRWLHGKCEDMLLCHLKPVPWILRPG